MAGIGDLGKLFGKGGIFAKGTVGEQLLIYGVMQQLLGAAMSPQLQFITRLVNEIMQATPLPPADLADMVQRGHIGLGDAEAYAKQSGVPPSDFQRMVDAAGESPGLTFLLEAFRRGYIPQSGEGAESISLEQGIREGRLHNKWIPVVRQMGTQPIGTADAVDAVVEGQIPYSLGEHVAYLNGIDADSFRVLVNTRGNPPSPSELATLLKRRLIPLEGTGPDTISFQQGIFEGASKDKWWSYYAKLADYIPPARTVVTLVHTGVVTDEEASVMLQDNGLSEYLAGKYIASAHEQRGATHKATISTELRTVARRGYADGHFSEAQFRQILSRANLPAGVIDSEVEAANLSKTIGRHTFSLAQIKQQRQHGLIDDAQALQRLLAAGWDESDAQAQINEWNTEAKVGRTGLTESRILAYLRAGILTQAQAYDLLVAQGINTANATFLVQHPESVPAVRVHGSTVADIIAAYKDGVLDLAQTRQKLIDAGDTAEAADLKLRIAHVQLNRGPKPRLAHKSLTEGQVLEALKLGLVADTWALRELSTMGYSDTDASLLVTIEETKKAGAVPASWDVLT